MQKPNPWNTGNSPDCIYKLKDPSKAVSKTLYITSPPTTFLVTKSKL